MIIVEPFLNANATWKRLTKHVVGVAAWGVLACFSGLLLLVLLLSENASAVNLGQSCLDVEAAQAADRVKRRGFTACLRETTRLSDSDANAATSSGRNV
jgi:hypothetical protein